MLKVRVQVSTCKGILLKVQYIFTKDWLRPNSRWLFWFWLKIDNKISFLLSTIILKINIITNALYILFIYNYKILIPLLYIYYKLFVNHINIFISNYNIQNIKYTVYKSTEPFVSVLTYIIFLSQMENIIKIF